MLHERLSLQKKSEKIDVKQDAEVQYYGNMYLIFPVIFSGHPFSRAASVALVDIYMEWCLESPSECRQRRVFNCDK